MVLFVTQKSRVRDKPYGALHLSELAGRTTAGPVILRMKSAFSKGLLLKNHLFLAHYL